MIIVSIDVVARLIVLVDTLHRNGVVAKMHIIFGCVCHVAGAIAIICGGWRYR